MNSSLMLKFRRLFAADKNIIHPFNLSFPNLFTRYKHSISTPRLSTKLYKTVDNLIFAILMASLLLHTSRKQ